MSTVHPSIRVALNSEGKIEATMFNRNYPTIPFRVLIEERMPGNLIETNVSESLNEFRWLIRAARKFIAS